jgi:uncharacterized protein
VAGPYLQRGAAQPVKWQREPEPGRPSLLVIGHFASHACAAYDDECFDDPEIARAIAASFRPVRIDAEERPDLAAQYQWLAEDGGGWPLICIVDGEGAARRVLGKLPRARLAAMLSEPVPATPLRAPAAGEPLAATEIRAVAEQAAAGLAAALKQHGVGFGPPPRFPHAPALSLLLESGGEAAELARRVIDAFSHGGLHDHLGGGFHHSSTDARWIVPHFEKHAIDQAVLLELPGADHRPSTLRYVTERLALPGGGYATSEAADSGPYDDGSYYTWTVDEARAALDDATDLAIAQRRFDIFGRGELHSDPTRNVLFIANSDAAIARELVLPAGEVTRRLPAIIARMRAAREARPRPPLDPTLHVAPSARLARACLDEHARHTLELLAERPSRGWLADEAQLGLAWLAAGDRDRAARCLDRARPLLASAPAWLARDGSDASPIALAGRLQLMLGEVDGVIETVRKYLTTAAALGVRGAGLIALAKALPDLQ